MDNNPIIPTTPPAWSGAAAPPAPTPSPRDRVGRHHHAFDVPVSTHRLHSSGAWTDSGATSNPPARTLTLTCDNSGFTGTLNLNVTATTTSSAPRGTVNVNGGRAANSTPPSAAT
jgi:hypothetical protein